MTDNSAGEQPVADLSGRLVSVNVGEVREIEWLGQRATTAIWKYPVAGRVAVRGVNLAGDDQADRRVHGGRDKALYAYSLEDEQWWSAELGRTLEPGAFGENLTISGLAVSGAVIGERWQIGSALLEVSQPRVPCWKLGARMGDPDFPPRFAEADRPGTYLRIIEEGDVGAGDEVRVVYRPEHGITSAAIAHIYHHDDERAELLLTVPELAPPLRNWAQRLLGYRRKAAKK